MIGRLFSRSFSKQCSSIARRDYSRFNIDTYKLVRQLERQGLSRGQAVSIMRTINSFLVDAVLDFTNQVISNEDLENQIYLYKSHLQKVRNELQVLRQNDSANLKADADMVLREIESLGQLFTELLAACKSDITMEMNNNKTEFKEKQFLAIDLKTHELSHKLVIQLSDLKTEIEGIKVELTSYIVWMTLGTLTCLMLIDAVFPTKNLKKEKSGGSDQSAAKPLGILNLPYSTIFVKNENN